MPVAAPFVAARYEYSPYGELLETLPDPRLITDDGSPITSPTFGFQSKYRDAETGFWYFGHRFFDSRCAQWLTHDPLREEGGFNLAAFCGGDPIGKVDPLGLWWWDNDFIGTAVQAGAENARAVWRFFWDGLAQAARNTADPLPQSLGDGLAAQCWNNVAGTGNWLWNGTVVAAVSAAEPRPQDGPIGVEMVSTAFFEPDIPLVERVQLAGCGAVVVVGALMDAVDYVPGPDDAFQRVARDTGTDVLRRQSLDVAGAASRGSAWFDDVARSATRNPGSDKLMLGHFSREGVSYQKAAAHYNATYFKVDNWSAVTKGLSQDEIWRINETFLTQQILQGKHILFSCDPLRARAGSFFEKEVTFLRDLGYSFRQKNQWTWEAVR